MSDAGQRLWMSIESRSPSKVKGLVVALPPVSGAFQQVRRPRIGQDPACVELLLIAGGVVGIVGFR